MPAEGAGPPPVRARCLGSRRPGLCLEGAHALDVVLVLTCGPGCSTAREEPTGTLACSARMTSRHQQVGRQAGRQAGWTCVSTAVVRARWAPSPLLCSLQMWTGVACTAPPPTPGSTRQASVGRRLLRATADCRPPGSLEPSACLRPCPPACNGLWCQPQHTNRSAGRAAAPLPPSSSHPSPPALFAVAPTSPVRRRGAGPAV